MALMPENFDASQSLAALLGHAAAVATKELHAPEVSPASPHHFEDIVAGTPQRPVLASPLTFEDAVLSDEVVLPTSEDAVAAAGAMTLAPAPAWHPVQAGEDLEVPTVEADHVETLEAEPAHDEADHVETDHDETVQLVEEAHEDQAQSIDIGSEAPAEGEPTGPVEDSGFQSAPSLTDLGSDQDETTDITVTPEIPNVPDLTDNLTSAAADETAHTEPAGAQDLSSDGYAPSLVAEAEPFTPDGYAPSLVAEPEPFTPDGYAPSLVAEPEPFTPDGYAPSLVAEPEPFTPDGYAPSLVAEPEPVVSLDGYVPTLVPESSVPTVPAMPGFAGMDLSGFDPSRYLGGGQERPAAPLQPAAQENFAEDLTADAALAPEVDTVERQDPRAIMQLLRELSALRRE
jgi:hypothetical protein